MRTGQATAGITIAKAVGIDPASICRTAFLRLIDALHWSRRADALRIIRRSQHLKQAREAADSPGIAGLRTTNGA